MALVENALELLSFRCRVLTAKGLKKRSQQRRTHPFVGATTSTRFSSGKNLSITLDCLEA